MLGRSSGGDMGRGLVPIHVGSRHLIRVLEAEARKLERAPLNRQVIVAVTGTYLDSRLKMDAHRQQSTTVRGARTFGVTPFSVCPGPLYSVYSQRRTQPLVRDRVRRAMSAKCYSVEQIVAKLREAEKLLAQDATSPSVSSMDSRRTT